MKNLKNLGQALTKAEQKTINGGGNCPVPTTQQQCQAIGGWWRGAYCIYSLKYCL